MKDVGHSARPPVTLIEQKVAWAHQTYQWSGIHLRTHLDLTARPPGQETHSDMSVIIIRPLLILSIFQNLICHIKLIKYARIYWPRCESNSTTGNQMIILSPEGELPAQVTILLATAHGASTPSRRVTRVRDPGPRLGIPHHVRGEDGDRLAASGQKSQGGLRCIRQTMTSGQRITEGPLPRSRARTDTDPGASTRPNSTPGAPAAPEGAAEPDPDSEGQAEAPQEEEGRSQLDSSTNGVQLGMMISFMISLETILMVTIYVIMMFLMTLAQWMKRTERRPRLCGTAWPRPTRHYRNSIAGKPPGSLSHMNMRKWW